MKYFVGTLEIGLKKRNLYWRRLKKKQSRKQWSS
jgi:hypothetical protein